MASGESIIMLEIVSGGGLKESIGRIQVCQNSRKDIWWKSFEVPSRKVKWYNAPCKQPIYIGDQIRC